MQHVGKMPVTPNFCPHLPADTSAFYP